VCDAVDNNCNGKLNENVANYGKSCASDDAEPDPGHGSCRTTGTYVCDGADATVCSAVKASCGSLPGGCEEKCDGIDNDCDGMIDETYLNKGSNAAYFVKPAVTQIGASLWMFTYESSRPDATSSNSAVGNGYHCDTDCPAGIPEPDTESAPLLDKTIACSVGDRIPWFNVTPVEAEQTCNAIGGHLCATDEWKNACETASSCQWGYYPRAQCCSESTETKYCNIHDTDTDVLLPTASTALANCSADWTDTYENNSTNPRIFDVTGNLREITKFETGTIYPLMGGAFLTRTESGATCDFDFYSVTEDYQFYDTGFRCCFSEDPTL
jgi:hypothetical protein